MSYGKNLLEILWLTSLAILARVELGFFHLQRMVDLALERIYCVYQ